MKSRTKQFLCITLVFILFFLGMCQQTTKAHSFLMSLQRVEEADTIDRIGAECSYINSGTGKLISGLRDTLQSCKRELIRAGLRWNTEVLLREEMLKVVLSFSMISAVILYRLQSSDITILKYIHKQDGEK